MVSHASFKRIAVKPTRGTGANKDSRVLSMERTLGPESTRRIPESAHLRGSGAVASGKAEEECIKVDEIRGSNHGELRLQCEFRAE